MNVSDFKRLSQDAQRAILEKKSRDIAALLNGWRFDNLSVNRDRFFLIGDRGAKIMLSFCSQNKSMVVVHFTWPKLNSWAICCRGWDVLRKDEEQPRFRFGITWKITRIVDLLGRLILPHYLDLFNRCREAKKIELEKRASVAVMVSSFKRIATPSDMRGDERRPELSFSRLSRARSCDVKVDLEDKCTIKVCGVNADLALRILGLCTEGG